MSFAAPSPRRLPRHIAIIMDGNGRWAKARGLPRIAGHRRGADAVRRTLEAVTSREATRIPSAPRTVIHDVPGVPIALAALAVIGFLALRRIRWGR